MTCVSFLRDIDASGLSAKEQALLESSYRFAKEAHGAQMRRSGGLYFAHPVAVARNLWMHFKDVELTCAGLLHDVLEDCTDVTRKKIYTQFGQRVGFLVDAVTKNYENFYLEQNKTFDKVEKVLWGGMQDIRVFLLKLADRDHNMETIEVLKDNKQVRIAFESHAIYEPLSELLQDDTGVSVAEIEKKFWKAIPRSWKQQPEKLEHFLLSQSFKNCDPELFGRIYTDSGSPLWSIEDWETYEKITSDKDLSRNIEFVSIKGNKDNFIANFRFTGGALIQGAKFDISGYRDNRGY